MHAPEVADNILVFDCFFCAVNKILVQGWNMNF